ncbi:MAG: aminopeptidase, partial [Haloarculaceae archaeon]
MDPRVRDHAEVIAHHSTGIEAGDNVVVKTPPEAEDLAVALHECIGELGATVVHLESSDRADRAYLRASDPEAIETATHEQALYEASDVVVRARGGANATEMGDVPPEANAAYDRAARPIKGEMLQTRWCLTQWPGAGYAQLAEMSTEAYEAFVWNAVNKDWDAQRDHQQRMVDILDPADEVRIVSGDTTDVRMSVDGMHTLNDYGEHNLPGGEVFTAPVVDSVEGEVLFDKPLYHRGREVEGAYLRFEEGAVVDHAAEKNESVLTEILETDDRARYLGELGIGMNRDIDRFTYNMLF